MVRMTPILATLSLVSKEGKCGRGASDPNNPDYGEHTAQQSSEHCTLCKEHGSLYMVFTSQRVLHTAQQIREQHSNRTAHGAHIAQKSSV